METIPGTATAHISVAQVGISFSESDESILQTGFSFYKSGISFYKTGISFCAPTSSGVFERHIIFATTTNHFLEVTNHFFEPRVSKMKRPISFYIVPISLCKTRISFGAKHICKKIWGKRGTAPHINRGI